jgi:hypothetical protein
MSYGNKIRIRNMVIDMDIVKRLREKTKSLEWLKKMGGSDKHVLVIMSDAADEIERLREENEKLKKGSRIVMEKMSWDAFQNASQEIERLREALIEAEKYNGYHQQACLEIERLREALRTICDGPRDVEKSYAELFAEVKIEARAALKGNE